MWADLGVVYRGPLSPMSDNKIILILLAVLVVECMVGSFIKGYIDEKGRQQYEYRDTHDEYGNVLPERWSKTHVMKATGLY